MQNSERLIFSCILLVLGVGWNPTCSAQETSSSFRGAADSDEGWRPVTVADAIEMTRTETIRPNAESGQSVQRVNAQFSPNGEFFAFVTWKGNLKRNTNDYSLVLYRTESALKGKHPLTLASFSSSSNRPGIAEVRWLSNREIAFLGEHTGEKQQVYAVDRETRRIRRLTNHPTSVVSYAFTKNGTRIVFLAAKPDRTLLDRSATERGITVTSQSLGDLISLRSATANKGYQDLFFKDTKSNNEVPLGIRGNANFPELWPSPDGNYVVLLTNLAGHPPQAWSDYRDEWLQNEIRRSHKSDATLIGQWQLVNLGNGTDEPLVDAPLPRSHSEVAWSSDSRSVVVTGTYLPLNVYDATTREERKSFRYAIEVDVNTKSFLPLSSRDLRLIRWDSNTGELVFEAHNNRAGETNRNELVIYKKSQSAWHEVTVENPPNHGVSNPDVIVVEDMNTPPRVVIRPPGSATTVPLLDLNPRFAHLRFGSVEEISFTATDGHPVKAGLYFPPQYVAGNKYPLVIQTHGWSPQDFWIDGPYTSGFAAQPLASRGFLVAQMEEDEDNQGKLAEVTHEASAYEGLIQSLESRGLVDSARIGLIGFSRTGLGVRYALTHSKYRFGAATIADGSDVGYMRYLAYLNSTPWQTVDAEEINNGTPFGPGLSSWINGASDFELDRVRTPLRLESNSPESLFFSWEWFAGLSRLERAVELIYMPDAAHVLVKPWNRRTSQQGNVDWFCFWLLGEEDHDPVKAQQYLRWRELRELQERSQLTRNDSVR